MSVHCHIAQCLIPKDICLAEQGRNCRGCKASTRLCLSCKRSDGIVDAIRGLCRNCSSVILSDTDQTGLEDVEACVTCSLTWMKKVHGLNGSSEIRPPTISSEEGREEIRFETQNEDLGYYFKLLLQHALLQEDGALLVFEPVRTLVARTSDPEVKRSVHPSQLSVSQCFSVIEQIVHAYGAILHTNGERTVLCIPGSSVPAKEPDRKGEPPTKTRACVSAISGPLVVQSNCMPERKAVPMMKSKPSDARILSLLAEESVRVGEERIVRGVIPLVQTRFLVGARFAREMVERLEREGFFIRKQEFACIALTDKPCPSEPEAINKADEKVECDAANLNEEEKIVPLADALVDRKEGDLQIRELAKLLSEIPDTQIKRLKRFALLSALLEEKRHTIEGLLSLIQEKTARIEAYRDARESIHDLQCQTERILDECTRAISRLFLSL